MKRMKWLRLHINREFGDNDVHSSQFSLRQHHVGSKRISITANHRSPLSIFLFGYVIARDYHVDSLTCCHDVNQATPVILTSDCNPRIISKSSGRNNAAAVPCTSHPHLIRVSRNFSRIATIVMVFGLSRLTPRRIILFTSASVVFWLLVIGLTPVTSPLPPYTGPHEVGILDVETKVQKQIIRKATLKETGKHAFELSTLAITLYYPSSLPNAPPSKRPWARPWLPQPVSLIGEGYARLAGVSFLSPIFTFALWALGSSTVIPGVVDAPILTGSEKVLVEEGAGAGGFGKLMEAAEQEHTELKRDEKLGLLPCVVFTHGMAGMSQSYSHYLGSIASHGYVVAAIEHRDGSGPGTIVHYPNETDRRVWHLKLKDLV